jgi:hypothetical protein
MHLKTLVSQATSPGAPTNERPIHMYTYIGKQQKHTQRSITNIIHIYDVYSYSHVYTNQLPLVAASAMTSALPLFSFTPYVIKSM